MFNHTLDTKPTVTDARGNEIVDLTKSIFRRSASGMSSYQVVRLNDFYEMRPDLVSIATYGSSDNTEFILKYSGISNPFSIERDDVLMIPQEDEAEKNMADNVSVERDETQTREEQIRNFYKFVNQDYKKDASSYEALENKRIESAVKDATAPGDYIVPYISEDNSTSITIKNGRMYFGEDAGLSTADVIKASGTDMDRKIQAVIDTVNTAMSDTNCAYNGLTMADFVRATVTSNFNN